MWDTTAVTESPAAREWQRLIRSAVRERVEAWMIQGQAGPVTPAAHKAIIARSAALLLRRREGHPLELMIALVPSLVRTMFLAFVEVVADQIAGRDVRE
jgi:hypothetical protein